MKEQELLDIIKEFVRMMPPCVGGCGRPATREADNDCRECSAVGGNVFCDTCDVSLAVKFRTTWYELPHATLSRKASKALKL